MPAFIGNHKKHLLKLTVSSRESVIQSASLCKIKTFIDYPIYFDNNQATRALYHQTRISPRMNDYMIELNIYL